MQEYAIVHVSNCSFLNINRYWKLKRQNMTKLYEHVWIILVYNFVFTDVQYSFEDENDE